MFLYHNIQQELEPKPEPFLQKKLRIGAGVVFKRSFDAELEPEPELAFFKIS